MPKSIWKVLKQRSGSVSIVLTILGLIAAIIFQIVDLKLQYYEIMKRLASITPATGGIDSPSWGAEVDGPEINCSGWVKATAPNEHIWLFVVPDESDKVWPQERLHSEEGSWSLKGIGLGTETAGARKWYWILLGVVDSNINKSLEEQKCLGKKDCPGMQKPPVRWLDAVHVKRR